MPHLVATALAGPLAGMALSLLPVSGALAQGGPYGPGVARPGAMLTLTVTHPEDTASSARTVTLTCDPAGGNHPQAVRTCAELADRAGSITRASANSVCTMEYRPVVAHATGYWRGRLVTFDSRYSNDCVMHTTTGSVFEF